MVLEQNMVGQHRKFKNKFEYAAIGRTKAEFAKMRFMVLAGITRSMLNQVYIPRVIGYKLFGEVPKTATKLD